MLKKCSIVLAAKSLPILVKYKVFVFVWFSKYSLPCSLFLVVIFCVLFVLCYPLWANFLTEQIVFWEVVICFLEDPGFHIYTAENVLWAFFKIKFLEFSWIINSFKLLVSDFIFVEVSFKRRHFCLEIFLFLPLQFFIGFIWYFLLDWFF